MATIPRREDLMPAGRRDLMPTGGIGQRWGYPNESGVDLEMLQPGQYFASAGGREMSNIPGLNLASLQEPAAAVAADPARLERLGAMFRTRSQDQELRRIERARNALASLRDRTSMMSRTQEGRERFAAAQAAPAAEHLRGRQRQADVMEQLGGRYVRPAEAKAAAAVEREKVRAAATQGEALTKKSTAELEVASKERIANLQESGATARLVQTLAADKEKARMRGENVDSDEYRMKQVADIDKATQIAKAEGHFKATLAGTEMMNELLRIQYEAQIKQSESPKGRAVAVPPPPMGRVAGVESAPAPVAAAPGVDVNQNQIPDHLDRFIGNIAALESSLDPKEQQRAIDAKQKMIRGGVSPEAVDNAIKAYRAAQKAKGL